MNVKKLEEKLLGYKFFPESGRACWYCYEYPIELQAMELGEPWAINYKNVNTSFASYSHNHIVKWFFIVKDEKEFIEFIGRYVSNPKLLDDLKSDTEDFKNCSIAIVKNKKFSTCTNVELGSILSDYFDIYKQFFKSTMTLRKIDRGVVATIRKDFPQDKVDEIIRTVSITSEPSFSLQEEIDVLNLAILIKEKGLNLNSALVEKRIKQLLDKYAWSVLGYYKELPNTMEIYKRRLADLAKENPKLILKGLNDRTVEDNKKREKMLKEFSDEQRKLAHVASSVAYLKDFVKSKINESQYHLESLFVEIAKRVGKSIDYVKDLNVEEIKMLLAGGSIDESLVKERAKENFIIAFDGGLHVLIGLDAKYIEEKYVESISNNTSKEFKGRIASVGYAKGRAVIVHDVGDFGKVLDGDILVVMNTSPDFLPVIRKAKAIVAEEGGITAHVSVVSREFGIPCVVGINKVTKLIKDGETVEVDADKGIVKIIK